MDGPPSGLYRISPSPEGHSVGALELVGTSQRPVVFEPKGREQLWQVEQFEPGFYRLTLDGPWYSNVDESKVLVDVRFAPGKPWKIKRWGDSAFFLIEDPSTGHLWTIPHKIPGEQVVLKKPDEPFAHQSFYFRPVEE